jgi:hypothetical protein
VLEWNCHPPSLDENEHDSSLGVARNEFGKIAPELKSNDPKVAAAFLKLILKTFALDDCDDLLLLRNRVGGHSGE